MRFVPLLNNPGPAQSSAPPGFTLIELLVVMLIIVILSGITISVTRYANWRARAAKADIEQQKIRTALDEYRAVYGEYPIVGDPGHYPTHWTTDVDTASNVPLIFRAVDLVNTTTNLDLKGDLNINPQGNPGVEYLPFGKNGYNVDYRLVYPLKMRPESEGRPAFMDFPLMTICYLAWKHVVGATKESGYVGETKDYRGIVRGVYLKGDPVNRYLAIDPVSGLQWKYECTNGTTYSLTTWDKDKGF